jgi:hypothetical protein
MVSGWEQALTMLVLKSLSGGRGSVVGLAPDGREQGEQGLGRLLFGEVGLAASRPVIHSQVVAETIAPLGLRGRFREARQVRRFDQPVQLFRAVRLERLRIHNSRAGDAREASLANEPDAHTKTLAGPALLLSHHYFAGGAPGVGRGTDTRAAAIHQWFPFFA